MRCIFLISTILIGSNLWAATYAETTGKINNVFHYGNGRVLVTGLAFPGASCNNNGGFWIPESHPHLNALHSTILSAQARQIEITVKAKIDDCWYPEIDTSTNSRIWTSN